MFSVTAQLGWSLSRWRCRASEENDATLLLNIRLRRIPDARILRRQFASKHAAGCKADGSCVSAGGGSSNAEAIRDRNRGACIRRPGEKRKAGSSGGEPAENNAQGDRSGNSGVAHRNHRERGRFVERSVPLRAAFQKSKRLSGRSAAFAGQWMAAAI